MFWLCLESCGRVLGEVSECLEGGQDLLGVLGQIWGFEENYTMYRVFWRQQELWHIWGLVEASGQCLDPLAWPGRCLRSLEGYLGHFRWVLVGIWI